MFEIFGVFLLSVLSSDVEGSASTYVCVHIKRALRRAVKRSQWLREGEQNELQAASPRRQKLRCTDAEPFRLQHHVPLDVGKKAVHPCSCMLVIKSLTVHEAQWWLLSTTQVMCRRNRNDTTEVVGGTAPSRVRDA